MKIFLTRRKRRRSLSLMIMQKAFAVDSSTSITIRPITLLFAVLKNIK